MKNIKIDDLKDIQGRRDIPKLLNLMKAQRICEVGVFDGSHFRSMLTGLYVEEAVAVDLWRETGVRSQNDCFTPQEHLEQMYQSLAELKRTDRRVRVIREYSIEASKLFANGHFDFVYLDADHTEAGCWADLNAWYPKVRPGGLLAGHDYFEFTLGEVKFGVREAVNRFVAEKGLKIHVDNDGAPELPAHNWYMAIPLEAGR